MSGQVRSFKHLTLVAAFLVPGLVALYVRSRFLTGRLSLDKDAVLGFFALPLVWYGFSAPFVAWLARHGTALYEHAWVWVLSIIVGPAAFGGSLGLDAQLGWSRRVLGRLGLRTVHVIPTAWDWRFSALPASWVVVTFKDGSRLHGFRDNSERGSFISSDARERDPYIGQVYTVGDDGVWTPCSERGVLVLAGDVRCTESIADKGAQHG